MTDVEEIAKGLDEGQREVLSFAVPGSPLPAWALREDHSGITAAGSIRRMKGLFEKVDMSRNGSQHWFYRLTPLGLSVRAVLQEKG